MKQRTFVELLLVSVREEISSHYGLGLPAMKLSRLVFKTILIKFSADIFLCIIVSRFIYPDKGVNLVQCFLCKSLAAILPYGIHHYIWFVLLPSLGSAFVSFFIIVIPLFSSKAQIAIPKSSLWKRTI